MESLRRVDISELEVGTVILVDTEDGKSYKLITFEETEDFGVGNVLLSEDTDEGETDAEKVVVSKLQIGKPMAIVTAPKRENVHGAFDMKSLQTEPITAIEVYS
jgi:hypothetical protein